LKISLKDETYKQELHTLLKFSSLISSSLKIEHVLNIAMEWAEEFICAEASTIYELDVDADELFVRIARGEKKEPVKSLKLKKGEGIAGRVVQTGKSIVVNDVLNEPRFSDKFDKVTGFNTKSMICVPLMVRDRCVGAIQVLNKKGPDPFSLADLELLTSMAQQIAITMENANLYSRLEEKFQITENELKATQEKFIRTERLAAVGNLVNGISHEIRNPIMTIGGFAYRIKEALDKESRLCRYADIILSETDRLDRLVRQIHEFVNIQSSDMELSSLGPVAQKVLEIYQPLAERSRVEIRAAIDPDMPQIKMDSSQIFTALSNVVENAFESISNEGCLELDIRHTDGFIHLVLRDTGSGIDNKELDSIYDPFFSLKPRGVGLGLTVAHQIIMNHHGEIEIHSEKDKGTTVDILLPVKN